MSIDPRSPDRFRTGMRTRRYWLAPLAGLILTLAADAANAPLIVLHVFGNSPIGAPRAGLVQTPDGSLYGVAYGAPTSASDPLGSVFKVAADGTFTYLHDFSGQADGGVPVGRLLLASDGNLYGVTTQPATIFKVTPANAVVTLMSLPAPPLGDLIQASDGNIYGTTSTTAFKLSLDGTLTTFYQFPQAYPSPTPDTGLVQGSDGNFYGTAYNGANGFGEIYQLTPAGVRTALYSFTAGGGDAPLLETAPGVFLGIRRYSLQSGSGAGLIYQITSAGSFTPLHFFNGDGSEGAHPDAALIKGADGNFYGTTIHTTYDPATGDGGGGGGTVYSVTSGGTVTQIHAFGGTDGQHPEAALLLGQDGNYYGTTLFGPSPYGFGTVFKLYAAAPPPPTVTISASPTTINRGQQAVLRWGSTDAGSCAASGAWSGTRAIAGSFTVQPFATSTYTLGCSGPGGSASASATVTVIPPAPTVQLSFSPASINLGQSSTLHWNANDATACQASGAWSGSRAVSGNLSVTPPAGGSYTYTLACTGPSGSGSGSATLTVAAPPNVSISTNPGIISPGQSATLRWSASNASACTASGAWSGPEPASGSQTLRPASPGSYAFTLTCFNAAGELGATAILTVQGGSGGNSSSGGGSSSGSSSGGHSSSSGSSSGGTSGGGGGGAIGNGALSVLLLAWAIRHRRDQRRRGDRY
jgi:uncharacterized repeat protein (TIGR03803 family)